MVNYIAETLVEFVRDGLVEQEHSGFVVKVSKDGSVQKIGDDKNYPFFLRSCAKPLQASLLIDFNLDGFFGMNSAEIAACCASHTGEEIHTNTIGTLLKKTGFEESNLKCGLHKPLSKTEQNKMLLSGSAETILQNNCSGKHTMMLGICKKMRWDEKNYDEISHPLQIAIKEKINSLCEVKGDYPITKDGCGVPIFSMPLENMVKGYLDLFLDPKYSKIKDAFLENPYIIGGEDRLDTAIMSANGDLISKVGAGGLCTVINLKKQEGLIIKILDCDMKARAVILIEALRQLEWLDEKMLENELIVHQNKKDILTLHGEKIGNAVFGFNI